MYKKKCRSDRATARQRQRATLVSFYLARVTRAHTSTTIPPHTYTDNLCAGARSRGIYEKGGPRRLQTRLSRLLFFIYHHRRTPLALSCCVAWWLVDWPLLASTGHGHRVTAETVHCRQRPLTPSSWTADPHSFGIQPCKPRCAEQAEGRARSVGEAGGGARR